MKKTIRQSFEKWALPLLKKYQKVLLLEDHNLLLLYSSSIENAYATHTFRYPYKETEIKYSPDLVDLWQKDREDAKGILIHELCHSLTDPLYAKATERHVTQGEINDERERLTDHIANIIIKATERHVTQGEINDERVRLTDHIANIIIKAKI